MKRLEVKEPEVRILVCTNERPTGKASCNPVGGQLFFQRLKERIGSKNLYLTHKLSRTGCLGYCNDTGCVVELRRKGKGPEYFSEVTDADFEALWKEIVNEK